MKLILFNINHCRIDQQGILDFLNEHKDTTDVFCLQEAVDVENIIDLQLSNFQKASVNKYITEHDTFGQVTYVADKYNITEHCDINEKYAHLAPAFLTKLSIDGNVINVVNYHGMSRPVDKMDCEDRLFSSNNMIHYLADTKILTIVGGDFNLDNSTQSIKLFEENGYKDLIKDFDIKSTRNEVAWKKYPDTKQYYSDYVFTKGNINARSLEVPYTEISDHLPLIVELEIN